MSADSLLHTKLGYNCENHKKLIVKQNPNVCVGGGRSAENLSPKLSLRMKFSPFFKATHSTSNNSNSHLYHKQVASLPLSLCKPNKSQAVLPFTLQLGQVTEILSTYLAFSLPIEYFKT